MLGYCRHFKKSGHGSDSDNPDLSLSFEADKASPFGLNQISPEYIMRLTGDGNKREVIVAQLKEDQLPMEAMMEESPEQATLTIDVKSISWPSTPVGV